MDTYHNQMTTITSTFFYDEDGCDNCKNPTFVNKEFSTSIIMDTIRESISSQYLHTFGAKPHYSILENLVAGFVLFNLHKNKNMLKSKDELLKYINNSSISLEEKLYFKDIFLYSQRPKFLTFDEHEYIRCCGNLEGYYEGCLDDDDDVDNYNNNVDIGNLFDSLGNTISIITNNYSALIAK
jgi:hypothetical protein